MPRLRLALALLVAAVVLLAAERPATADAARKGAASRDMLWGTWTDTHRTGSQPPWDMSAVAEIEREVGKGMSLIHFSTPMAYANGTSYFGFPVKEFDAIRGHGSIPFFSWSTHAMRNPTHPDFTLGAIIAGRQDAAITRWAQAARDWGSPFFLRFNWEMNGDWFPWGERYGSNRPGQYVAAWRHVHDIFRRVGATNATWVWCPSADPWRTEQRLRSLYPGDRYVDWTCLDVYNYNDPWRSFARLAGSSYDEVAAIAPGKPMVLGELGSTESGGSKAKWIGDMFDALPRRFPLIRGLSWFDKRESGSSRYVDYPLDSSRSATTAFARGISARRYRASVYGSSTGSRITAP